MSRGALKRIRTAALRFGLVTLLLVRGRSFVLCRRRFLQKVDQICESNEESTSEQLTWLETLALVWACPGFGLLRSCAPVADLVNRAMPQRG